MDGRLPVHGSFRDTVPGIEVNLQTLAFRMEGNQMQAMDEEAAQDEDVLHILGTGAKTMVCKGGRSSARTTSSRPAVPIAHIALCA